MVFVGQCKWFSDMFMMIDIEVTTFNILSILDTSFLETLAETQIMMNGKSE
jgi:hypothetical protein